MADLVPTRLSGVFLSVAGALALAPLAVKAQDPGLYIGASVGIVAFGDQDFAIAPGTSVETDLDSTADGSFFVGYDFGQIVPLGGVRTELQYSYRSADVNRHSINGVPAFGSFGSLEESAGFLNFYFDFETAGTQWAPYLGAGIGYGEVSFDTYGTLDAGVVLDQRDSRMGYQLIAGIGYAFTPQSTAFIDYKFRDYGDFDVTAATGFPTSLSTRSNSVNLGFRFSF